MKGFAGSFMAAAFVISLAGGAAWATPPGPGQHFNCSNGGDSSCATDYSGCVSDTKDHLKCSGAIGKAFSKAVASVVKCHGKQATARFKNVDATTAGNDEENCENAAQSKLDAAFSKISSLCGSAQNSGAALEELVLFGGGSMSIDQQNNMVFCDNSSGTAIGGDDTGDVQATAGISSASSPSERW